jgi:hypothetical protein
MNCNRYEVRYRKNSKAKWTVIGTTATSQEATNLMVDHRQSGDYWTVEVKPDPQPALPFEESTETARVELSPIREQN